MKSVSKFGGSSIQDAKAIKNCAEIIKNHPHTTVVVVSATKDTTKQLEDVGNLSIKGQKKDATYLLAKINSRHLAMALDLKGDDALKKRLDSIIVKGKALIEKLSGKRDPSIMDHLYGLGERLSCELFFLTLGRTLKNKQIKLMDACELIITDGQHGQANPDLAATERSVKNKLIPLLCQDTLIVTQGFIGATKEGVPTTLGRESSDLSGSLLAKAVCADSYYIWTDVSGIYQKDPRVFPDALKYRKMGYKQALNLARQGAKVLFDKTMDPLMNSNISVYIKNSYHPEDEGTWIYPD